MKKFFAVIFSFVVLAAASTAMSSCGCSNSQNSSVSASQNSSQQISSSPEKDLVGNWGERSDNVEAEFNDDGTCKIGGVNGTYSVDDKHTLTVTPDGDNAAPMTFEYAPSDSSSVAQNQWRVSGNKLYINGYQYSKTTSENKGETKGETQTSSSSESNGSDVSSSAASSKDSSSPTEKSTSKSQPSSSKSESSSSSKTESRPSSSESSSSGSAESKPSDSSSTSSSSTVTSSSGISSSQPDDGAEDDIITIYQNLDDFVM